MAAMTYSYYPADVLPQQFCVTRGANDLLFTEDGKQYIDLLLEDAPSEASATTGDTTS